jgi:hypothetical protein
MIALHRADPEQLPLSLLGCSMGQLNTGLRQAMRCVRGVRACRIRAPHLKEVPRREGCLEMLPLDETRKEGVADDFAFTELQERAIPICHVHIELGLRRILLATTSASDGLQTTACLAVPLERKRRVPFCAMTLVAHPSKAKMGSPNMNCEIRRMRRVQREPVWAACIGALAVRPRTGDDSIADRPP